jgi:hypothetical protein
MSAGVCICVNFARISHIMPLICERHTLEHHRYMLTDGLCPPTSDCRHSIVHPLGCLELQEGIVRWGEVVRVLGNLNVASISRQFLEFFAIVAPVNGFVRSGFIPRFVTSGRLLGSSYKVFLHGRVCELHPECTQGQCL